MKTPADYCPQATLAALALFNGLHLSPIYASPDPRLTHIGENVTPKFVQLQRYMARFFTEKSTPEDFNPLEIFNGALASAQWIRGGAGVLQYALFNEYGIDTPNDSAIDPAAWFRGLDRMADLWRKAGQRMPPELVLNVLERWQERPGASETDEGRAGYLARLYAQARGLQTDEGFLTTVPTITRARVSRPLAEGQTLPFPHN